VAARPRDACLRVVRALALHGAEPDIRETDQQPHCQRPRRASPQGDEHGERQHRREQRIDDRHPVPADAGIAEWPQQSRAPRGRGVEQPVRAVPERGGHRVASPMRAGAWSDPPRQRRDEAAQRDKRQRMREVSMELGVEERVAAAADRRVHVGEQRADDPGNPCRAAQRPCHHQARRGAADQGVGEGVHIWNSEFRMQNSERTSAFGIRHSPFRQF
jgi:hypothetical protein